MKDPSQEDLLGYVLGALDADQQHDLQQRIDNDPRLDEKLLEIRSQLTPLELLDEPSGSRPGLARRTCEMVAGFDSGGRSYDNFDGDASAAKAELRTGSALFSGGIGELLHRNSGWSMNDILVATASLAVMACLLFPALSYSKHRSQVTDCSNNLRSVGFALASFSEAHDGKFVDIPADGPLAFVGVLAPVLKEAGLVEDDSWFTCQGAGRNEPFEIPSTEQIRVCASGDQRDYFRRNACGDYGYSFGHMKGRKYVSPQNLCQAYQIICADKPSVQAVGGPSDNHRGKGQNCLFGDFHIEFIKGNARGDDQIYVNARNVVAPGVCPRDSVIGASHLSPLQSPHLNCEIYGECE